MPRPKSEKPQVAVQEVEKFDPASLTAEQQEAVVELYLGVHPKFFVYRGTGLNVDIWNLNMAGKQFNGFKPHLRELGIE